MRIIAAIPSPPINDLNIGPLRITFYGIIIAIGVLVAWLITRNRYKARGGDIEVAEKVIIRMVLFGFIGARIAYVLPRLDQFVEDPLSILRIWEGGLALFGGLTVGGLALLYYGRKLGADLPSLFDSLAPAIPVAQAIGRWGNYFNQELFGTPSDLPWAVEIDPEFRPPEYAEFDTFHPTFLYESILNLLLAGFIVWAGNRFQALQGRLIGVYFIGYGLIRFGMELLRTDTTFRFLGLSRNGWVSIAAVIIGLTVILWPRRDEDTGSHSSSNEA